MAERKPAQSSEMLEGERQLNRNDEISHEDIARLAYVLWEERGSGDGLADQDWLEAERQLKQTKGETQAA